MDIRRTLLAPLSGVAVVVSLGGFAPATPVALETGCTFKDPKTTVSEDGTTATAEVKASCTLVGQVLLELHITHTMTGKNCQHPELATQPGTASATAETHLECEVDETGKTVTTISTPLTLPGGSSFTSVTTNETRGDTATRTQSDTVTELGTDLIPTASGAGRQQEQIAWGSQRQDIRGSFNNQPQSESYSQKQSFFNEAGFPGHKQDQHQAGSQRQDQKNSWFGSQKQSVAFEDGQPVFKHEQEFTHVGDFNKQTQSQSFSQKQLLV